MLDIWSFLLQTLTASGAAGLLLVVKGLFRDKLPPKWHFALWSVLGIVMLIPAGWNGRYVLVNWRVPIEALKVWLGQFSTTRVRFPFPVMTGLPRGWEQWLFALYFVGVLCHLGGYLRAYCRLRRVVGRSGAASEAVTGQVARLSAELGIRPCRVLTVEGTPSAFVCGTLRPVLVVPEGVVPDDRIVMHELLHVKYHDTLWSAVICALRSIHWCDPFLVWCAGRALNDMECRCDQRVLDRLEGEARRGYGHILLSMVNDRFARTPGTTCINNGGKQIRERIRAIAWYRRYPAGMGMVSACVLVLLALPLVVGTQATEIYDPKHDALLASFASARGTPCTTYAGAFDAYGKAVLVQNGYYRAMCAPADIQQELYTELVGRAREGLWPEWGSGSPVWLVEDAGYYVYGLEQTGDGGYEGFMVFEGAYPPEGMPEELGRMYLIVQRLRVWKEDGRWVAMPMEGFRTVEALEQSLDWGCPALPGIVYTDTVEDIRIDVKVQTICTVESREQVEQDMLFGAVAAYDTVPKPHASFTRAVSANSHELTHLGTREEQDAVRSLGLSVAPVWPGEEAAAVPEPIRQVETGGGDNRGNGWASTSLDPGWGPAVQLGGGGSSTFDPRKEPEFPDHFVADLYVDGEFIARTALYPQEGAS